MPKTSSPDTDAALLGMAGQVRAILADAERQDTLARHRVGGMLCAARESTDTYGTHAVERVAAEIGIVARVLYRYIAVAETWSEAELTTLVARTTRFGQPLTWSHFVALTSVREPRRRAGLLDECVANIWSVRELARKIEELLIPDARTSDEMRHGEPVLAALNEGVQTVGRAVASLRSFEDDFGERLAEAEEPIDDLVLARAEEKLEQFHARTGSMLEQVRVGRRSQVRVRCPSPSAGTKAGGKPEVDEADDDPDEASPSSRSLAYRAKRR